MLHVRLEQHPVGQGGFLTGRLHDGGARPFTWAFDCGSNHEEPLKREIRRAARHGRLDILFLSHLHADHVSGIDRLLGSMSVDEVVLPYLTPDLLTLAICQALAEGALSGLFLDFAGDPAAWLVNRGVRSVTFVRGGGDEGGGGGEEAPDFPVRPESEDRRGAEKIGMKWSAPPKTVRRIGRRGGDAGVAREVEGHAVLGAVAGTRELDWLFVPHAHAPPPNRLAAFRAALRARFGTISPKAIAAVALSEKGRSNLRECYDFIWIDHNLVSMSLYAGPSSRFTTLPHRSCTSPLGWLLTGDANLCGITRRRAFLRRYRPFLLEVEAFQLPHHGSAHNFSEELLDEMPYLNVAFAASGQNSYGHPHPLVKEAVRSHGRARFQRVAKRAGSGLCRNFTMGWS